MPKLTHRNVSPHFRILRPSRIRGNMCWGAKICPQASNMVMKVIGKVCMPGLYLWRLYSEIVRGSFGSLIHEYHQHNLTFSSMNVVVGLVNIFKSYLLSRILICEKNPFAQHFIYIKSLIWLHTHPL